MVCGFGLMVVGFLFLDRGLEDRVRDLRGESPAVRPCDGGKDEAGI
jgi:hypothetical protein